MLFRRSVKTKAYAEVIQCSDLATSCKAKYEFFERTCKELGKITSIPLPMVAKIYRSDNICANMIMNWEDGPRGGYNHRYEIGVSTSALELLTNEELRFFAAHEIGHIKNERGAAAWNEYLETRYKLEDRLAFCGKLIVQVAVLVHHNEWKKKNELKADEFAVNLTNDAAAGISALKKTMSQSTRFQDIRWSFTEGYPTHRSRIRKIKAMRYGASEPNEPAQIPNPRPF